LIRPSDLMYHGYYVLMKRGEQIEGLAPPRDKLEHMAPTWLDAFRWARALATAPLLLFRPLLKRGPRDTGASQQTGFRRRTELLLLAPKLDELGAIAQVGVAASGCVVIGCAATVAYAYLSIGSMDLFLPRTIPQSLRGRRVCMAEGLGSLPCRQHWALWERRPSLHRDRRCNTCFHGRPDVALRKSHRLRASLKTALMGPAVRAPPGHVGGFGFCGAL
jgi:hypothetical protein